MNFKLTLYNNTTTIRRVMAHALLAVTTLLPGCGETSPASSSALMGPTPVIFSIGDSVTQGWTPFAAVKTEGKVIWHRLSGSADGTWPENARNTHYTLSNVKQWLGYYPRIDVLFWNNGVWDASKPNPNEPADHYEMTDDEYRSNLVEIAKAMTQKARKVYFLTTTPLDPSDINEERPARERGFNKIAKEVLPPLGVEIIDLHAFVLKHPDWHAGNDLHFNGYGNEYISEYLVHEVLKL